MTPNAVGPSAIAPRPLGLTLVLSIVAIAGMAAILSTWTKRAESMARYPLLTTEILYSLLAVTALGVLGIAGIFRWRRWGLYLFMISGAAYFGLEWFALQGTPKSLRILMAMILVGLNVMPLLWRFR